MAIAVKIHVKGGTLEQYDAANKALGHEVGGRAPEGCLFHWAGKTDDGIMVTDVWESREAFESFGKKLGPALGQAGMPEPTMTFHEVHGWMSAAAPSGVR